MVSVSAAERLRRDSDRVMKVWANRASKEIQAAKHQGKLALWDFLPQYLAHLANALSTTINRTNARIKADRAEATRIGQVHGHDRAGSLDYTIDQLISEYHILRQVICDVLEEEGPLSPAEREIITGSIEQAVNDAATQFSDTLMDIKEKLTHTLAHDLRSPITATKTSAQLILRSPNDMDHCIKMASFISLTMDHMDSMVHDLLDVSMLRAGQSLPLQFGECDLDLLARQVAEEFNFRHDNCFEVISPAQCFGYWSQSALRRVIENLLTNAVKYGTPGATVTITVQQTAEDATLSVHNEGKSILPSERRVLFQQFRRARSPEAKEGWGLGLTIVKGVTEAHCGSVEVDSEEGRGTTFRIKLPKDWRKMKAVIQRSA